MNKTGKSNEKSYFDTYYRKNKKKCHFYKVIKNKPVMHIFHPPCDSSLNHYLFIVFPQAGDFLL
jgi:hypothetical protein